MIGWIDRKPSGELLSSYQRTYGSDWLGAQPPGQACGMQRRYVWLPGQSASQALGMQK